MSQDQSYHGYGHMGSISMSDSSNVLEYPSPYMSFSESLLQGSYDNDMVAHAFGLSSSSMSSSHMFYPVKEEKKPVVTAEGGDYRACVSETQVTTNSSFSSSSNEAVVDEESNKLDKKDEQVKEIQEEDESPKKENKSKKKSEKKEKQPRFAFMTKSEVDHLEDGYRWRKYGQKAVKNSPYPRGYYRCTTQKCQVKKRVERSFQDPSVVITTYEGTHNHHVPTNMRGNVGGMFQPYMFTPAHLSGSNFDPEVLAHMPNSYSYGGGESASGSSVYHQTLTPFQQMQFSHDYGLLQDVVPSMFLKQEP